MLYVYVFTSLTLYYEKQLDTSASFVIQDTTEQNSLYYMHWTGTETKLQIFCLSQTSETDVNETKTAILLPLSCPV